jgi:hypothetical protein
MPTPNDQTPRHAFTITEEEASVLETALDDYVMAWRDTRDDMRERVKVAEGLLARVQRLLGVVSWKVGR